MKACFRSILFLLLLLLQTPAQAIIGVPDTLRVALRLTPPFVQETENGKLEGLAVELWQDMARDLGQPWVWQAVELQELLDGVTAGQFDVGIGGLTITAERETLLDFGHQFLSGGLAVAVASQNSWLDPVRTFWNLKLLRVLLLLGALLCLVGLFIWLLERKKNPDQFGGGLLKGIGSGFWFSAVTMTTVGYGDKAPISFFGRLLALFWMFAGLILASSFTAAITTAMTVGRLESGIRNLADLRKAKVATVSGSTASAEMRQRGIPSLQLDSISECLKLLEQGSVQGVVYDSAILRYLVLNEFSGLMVLPEEFVGQNYAFVYPEKSMLRESANRSMLKLLSHDDWRRRKIRWLGAGE